MRNAPVAGIIYELLYDMYRMMDVESAASDPHYDENGVLCETFDHGFTSKWEWSMGLLRTAGAVKPIYPPHLFKIPGWRGNTYLYTPILSLEECLATDFSMFETFDNYCFAMFTFDQFVDREHFSDEDFSSLFIENLARKDDIFVDERKRTGSAYVDWIQERYEEKVLTRWNELMIREFKAKT